MLEMAGSGNDLSCHTLSHSPLSSGYACDMVPLGQAMVEHDTVTGSIYRQFLMFGCKHCENIVEEPKILSQYLCFQHYKNI